MRHIPSIILVIFGWLFWSGCAAKSQIQVVGKDSGFRVVKAEGGEVFFEDFNTYGMGKTPPFGEWKSKGSNIRIEESIQPNGRIGKVLRVERGMFIYLDKDWGDYAFEVNWKDGEPALYFRISSNGSKGYYITKGLGFNTPVKLFKFSGSSSWKVAESRNYDTPGGKWFYWRIEVKDGHIKVYLDGEKIIDVVDDDPSLSKGGIGIGSKYGGVSFDNVRVVPL